MRTNGERRPSGIQNIPASIRQYTIQAGEPAQPVQQSVVIASMRGFFLRVALPSPTDIGSCFSTMSKMPVSASAVMCETLTYRPSFAQRELGTVKQSSRSNNAPQTGLLLTMLL